MKIELTILALVIAVAAGFFVVKRPYSWPPQVSWPPQIANQRAATSPAPSSSASPAAGAVPLDLSTQSSSSAKSMVTDSRLPSTEPIVGFIGATEEVVIAKASLPDHGLFETTLDGRPLEIVTDFSKKIIIGFVPVLTDGRIHLIWDGGLLKDKETKSTWDITSGQATDGQLKGNQLTTVPARDSSWGVWVQVFSNSRILK